MAWVILVVSGLFEAVWALALDRTEGFSRLVPSVIFIVALVISMGGLGWALRDIPVAVGYAVWVGIGVVATAAYSFATGQESVTVAKMLFLAMILGGVVGFKVVD